VHGIALSSFCASGFGRRVSEADWNAGGRTSRRRSHVTPPRDERQPPMLPQRLHMLDHRFLIAIPVPVRRGNQFKTCDSPHHPSSHTANSVANFPFFPSHTYRIRHHGVSNGVGYDAAAIGPRVRCEIEPSTTAKISLCLIWAIWAISLGLSTSSASGYGRIRHADPGPGRERDRRK
jgi:hypothetical protein